MELLDRQRAFFASHATRGLDFRLGALRRLEEAVLAHEQRLVAALQADFRRSPFETYVTETGLVLGDLRLLRRCLRRWARPERVPGILANWPSSNHILREPYGVSLIVGTWNYPFQLAVSPLAGALAAGNCAVLKLSPEAPATAEAVAAMLGEAFPPEHVAVVQGDRPVLDALLEERFDHIFCTGSPALGREVMARAAAHLTPLTLELGGKCPCIVDADADLPVAARRIAWGKFLNAGQTCVAPDHLWVHRSVLPRLVALLKEALLALYGPDPRAHPDYPRIINARHVARLQGLLGRGRIVHGGQCVEAERYLAPTLLEDVGLDDPIMQEEIFGPLLPVLPFDTLEEVLIQVNARPKPLALYYFSRDRARQAQVLGHTSSGAACLNDTVAHVANPNLPFGGVGASGMGGYHGRASFEAFSHRRAVFSKPTWIDLPLRYAPYAHKLWLVRRLLG